MKPLQEVIIRGVHLTEILHEHQKWTKNNGGSQANLSDEDMSYMDLSELNLSYSICVRTVFSDSIMVNTKLAYVDATGANFDRSWLRGSDLRYAKLKTSSVNYADMRDCQIGGAIFNEASLYKTDLSNVINGEDKASFRCSRIVQAKMNQSLFSDIADQTPSINTNSVDIIEEK